MERWRIKVWVKVKALTKGGDATSRGSGRIRADKIF